MACESGEIATITLTVIRDVSNLSFSSKQSLEHNLEFEPDYQTQFVSPPITDQIRFQPDCQYSPPGWSTVVYELPLLDNTFINTTYGYTIPGLYDGIVCQAIKQFQPVIMCGTTGTTGSTFFDISINTGEYGSGSLVIEKMLDGYAYTAELLSATLTTYISIQLPLLETPTGESTSIGITSYSNIDTICYTAETCLITGLTVGNPIDLGISRGYTGSNGVSSLVTSLLIAPAFYTAEQSDLSLSTYPMVVLGDVVNITGESLDTDIQCSSFISAQSNTGSTLAADLSIYPSIDFGAVLLYAGEISSILVSANISLFSDAVDGEYTNVDVAVFPSSYINIDMLSGESATYQIQTSSTIQTVGYTGETNSFSLTYIVNSGLPLLANSGERFDIDSISIAYSISSVGYTGEYYSATLAVSEPFSSIIGYTGETSLLVLTDNKAKTFDIAISDGTSAIATLNFNTTFYFRSYVDSTASADIWIPPTAPIAADGYCGEQSAATLQTGIQLGTFSFWAGELCYPAAQIGNEPIIRSYTGETALSTIATSYIIDLSIGTDNRATTTLDTHPSESIGTFRAVSGSLLYSGLNILVSSNLSVTFYDKIWVQCDIDSQTNFDLQTDDCCGQRVLDACGYNFELDFAPMPDERYDSKNFVFFSVELQTRSNLFASAYTGEFSQEVKQYSSNLALDDNGQPQILMTDGISIIIDLVADQSAKLCRGFFIPDGDNIETELTDVLDEDCVVNRSYTGSTMKIPFLRAEAGLSTDDYTGERLSFDLELNKPWELKAYYGERMLFNLIVDVALPFNRPVDSGETFFIKFKEDEYLSRTGETADVTVSTDISVEFLEGGCLENEYRYFDEDGREIQKKISIAMEEKQYLHDIRVRCF